MKRDLGDLIVELDEDSITKIVENWTWLVGTDKIPILISAIGDMFLLDHEKKVYWLDVGTAN